MIEKLREHTSAIFSKGAELPEVVQKVNEIVEVINAMEDAHRPLVPCTAEDKTND